MSLFRQLMNTTARIETVDSRGGRSTGTSFFFGFQLSEQEGGLLLVTNRHVLKDQQIARVAVSVQGDAGTTVEHVIVPDVPSRAIFHPDDQVDLAALPWGGCHSQLMESGRKPLWIHIGADNILTDETARNLSSFESLVIIGYPNGIWDSVHNLPIIRSANTATPLDIDYRGQAQFLINGACFGGSSGSPVLLANEGSYASNNGLVVGSRLYLAGVLSATYTQDLEGQVVEAPIPTGAGAALMSIARLPIHIGICIKAREILRLADVARDRHGHAHAA